MIVGKNVMTNFEEKLNIVVESLIHGDVDVYFHYPYVGCPKTEILEYLEEHTEKSVIIYDGELSFSLIANIDNGENK